MSVQNSKGHRNDHKDACTNPLQRIREVAYYPCTRAGSMFRVILKRHSGLEYGNLAIAGLLVVDRDSRSDPDYEVYECLVYLL